MSECSIPARYRLRVKQRLVIVAFAREHGIKPASRHFSFARRTVRTWLRRWTADGEVGLVPKYPRRLV
jgi:transposase